jgi:hypothetical protein
MNAENTDCGKFRVQRTQTAGNSEYNTDCGKFRIQRTQGVDDTEHRKIVNRTTTTNTKCRENRVQGYKARGIHSNENIKMNTEFRETQSLSSAML